VVRTVSPGPRNIYTPTTQLISNSLRNVNIHIQSNSYLQ
jgi:hypothetical protein